MADGASDDSRLPPTFHWLSNSAPEVSNFLYRRIPPSRISNSNPSPMFFLVVKNSSSKVIHPNLYFILFNYTIHLIFILLKMVSKWFVFLQIFFLGTIGSAQESNVSKIMLMASQGLYQGVFNVF